MALARELGVGTFDTYDTGDNVYINGGQRSTYNDMGPTGTAPLDPVILPELALTVQQLDQMSTQVPVFEQTLSTLASVAPAVLRICICIWSNVIVSVQCGWYQNVSWELPDGTATVCVSVLSPLTGLAEPSCAA